MGKVHSISISAKKGCKKTNISEAMLRVEHGIDGDAHAGNWHRQVSLLAKESIDKMIAKGVDVSSGDFAENITTEGMDLLSLPVGTRIFIGETELEISQIGKECHNRCAIYHQVGDCVMPKEGIFAIVIKGGNIKPGDMINIA